MLNTKLIFPLEHKNILIVDYADKSKIKEKGGKWDSENKFWYFEGVLPEELNEYKSYEIFVEYENKDIFKSKYKSLKWYKEKKIWLCNEKDYKLFIT